jgi:hypothetical protein
MMIPVKLARTLLLVRIDGKTNTIRSHARRYVGYATRDRSEVV